MTEEERELLTCQSCGAVLDRPPEHCQGDLFVCDVCWRKGLKKDDAAQNEKRAKVKYQLCPAGLSKGDRCDTCGEAATQFVFLSLRYRRWQRRCRCCADRMVADGKATY